MKLIRYALPCFLFVSAVLMSGNDSSKVVSTEIGKHNTDQLPKGKEADGIIGDFVLRNDRIHALISGAQPLRRANMRTENAFVTQGVLYDLDLVGEDNDQITAFRPGNAGGEVSWVKTIDGPTHAGIESVRTAAKGEGLYTRHEYQLEPKWQHILITSTYRNESARPISIRPAAEWRGFEDSRRWAVGDIHVADSTDPFDKRAYAWSFFPADKPSGQEVAIAPGQEKKIRTILAVASSPVEAYGILQQLFGSTGTLSGRVADSEGAGAIHATFQIALEGVDIPLYPDRNGKFQTHLPPGQYTLKFQDLGREPFEKKVIVIAGKETQQNIQVEPAARVKVIIRDEHGAASPGKVQFIGVDGTATPFLGTPLRAHGSDHQYFTHNGQFTQQVPVGRYLLRFTRGPEFELAERQIEIGKGKSSNIEVTLRRVVDTKGWISADFHSHSTISGDNYCATDDRIINLAAENIEFAPATEHNRFYDWMPHINRLGLSQKLKSVTGIEFTSNDSHLNGFPFDREDFAQDFGAPVYDPDVRISALRLRGWVTPSLKPGGSRHDTYQNSRARILPSNPKERWIQLNHPSVGGMFFDRHRDGLEPGMETLFDGTEVWSTDILSLTPTVDSRRGLTTQTIPNRTFGWLQLLNQGRQIWAVAVSDSHGVARNGSGGWRMFIPSSTDEPSKIDTTEIVRNAKAGQLVLTNGPFLTVTTGKGEPVGSTVMGSKSVDLKIRVQTPDWMEVNRVQVLVSGRQPNEYNFTQKSHPQMFKNGVVRFDETVHVTLSRDEHLIVVATGEGTNLSKLWGRTSYAQMQPLAYTNPIFVDVDGNGFHANQDTLGFPLLSDQPAKK